MSRRSLQDDYARIGVIAREIVAKRVTILLALGVALGVLVQLHVIPSGLSDDVTRYAGEALAALGAIVGVAWARTATTPADPALAPTSSNGLPLTEQGVTSTSAANGPAPTDTEPDLSDIPVSGA